MDQESFIAQLQQQGFSDVSTVTRAPGGYLDTHTHPFEARALILAGDIRITCDGRETLYRPGEMFHLDHGEPHTESYGPEGVTYLVGRK